MLISHMLRCKVIPFLHSAQVVECTVNNVCRDVQSCVRMQSRDNGVSFPARDATRSRISTREMRITSASAIALTLPVNVVTERGEDGDCFVAMKI